MNIDIDTKISVQVEYRLFDYLIICGKYYDVKFYNTIFAKKETSFEFQCSEKKRITKIINLGQIQIFSDNYIP